MKRKVTVHRSYSMVGVIALVCYARLATCAFGAAHINEVLARNQDLVYQNANPDFIEFYNDGKGAIDLSGCYLSTTGETNGAWVFPSGVILPAGGYQVVWCEGGHAASLTLEANLNLGSGLSGDSGSVTLFDSAGRVLDSVAYGFQVKNLSFGLINNRWALLASPTPGAGNSTPAITGDARDLKINEWMASPASGPDWFEFYNRGTNPVSMEGCRLSCVTASATNQFSIPALCFIGPDNWTQWIADKKTAGGANHVSFSLSKQGATMQLESLDGFVVDRVEFGPQLADVSEGRLPDGASNIVRFVSSATPGARNFLPLTNVWVNEVLSHTDPPLEDAVELFNPTSADIEIGGWFLSNSLEDLKKYRIPDGAKIKAGGYYVMYEYQFKDDINFTFNSAHGDAAYLSTGDAAGNFTGYRVKVAFGAAAHGVSFGRFETSVGTEFVAMSRLTFGVDNPVSLQQFRAGAGESNAAPLVGPVVISEIMYQPPPLAGPTNTVDNTRDEYLELCNISAGHLPLYDVLAPTNAWKINGGIQYAFPTGIIMPPGSVILVVHFDPAGDPAALASFRARYPAVPAQTPLFGPYSGKLGNSGDTIELYKPDPPQEPPHPDAGFVPYVLVERIVYQNAAPWPLGAAGTGSSLHRLNMRQFGNEPLNWRSAAPSPGQAETAFLFLKIGKSANGVTFSFPAEAGKAYRAQFTDRLPPIAWSNLKDIPAQATAAPLEVIDRVSPPPTNRFYRVISLP